LSKYKDRVVIGEMFADEEGPTGKTKKLNTPNPRLLLPGTESVVGLVNIWTDADDVIRRARYQTSSERELLETPGISPNIVEYLNKNIRAGKIPDNLAHITARAAEKFQGKIYTPPPTEKTFINFQNPANTYRALPVENLFVDSLWKKPSTSFSNKIVIVGPMAEIFHDVHATPFREYGETPGPEIQAQMLAALLQGEWLTETSARMNLWLDCAAVDAQTAAAFIVPAPEGLLEAYPVSTAVNRTANDGPELIAPVSVQEAPAPEAAAPKRTRRPKPDKRQPSLF